MAGETVGVARDRVGMDEQDAIARLRRGDIGGLEVLVRRHQHAALRVAFLIGRDAALAEDDEGTFSEEGGQRVQRQYWEEAHNADVAGRFQQITAPTFVFFATADALVSTENRQALIDVRREHQRIELLAGWPHSAWTYGQATHVIARTVSFLASNFN